MSSSYESNFRMVTTLAELPLEEPRLFRAAGASIVLRRTKVGVTALDGSCLPEEKSLQVRVENGEIWVCVEACRPS